MKNIVLIGYSGHSYIVIDTFASMKRRVTGYCEEKIQCYNPYNLKYHGREMTKTGINALVENDWFISIGNNKIRERIFQKLTSLDNIRDPINSIHTTSVLGSFVNLKKGILIAANSSINSHVTIEEGVICNTGSVIEHECHIGSFSHIAPGAVLTGNVKVGSSSFIGANSVIREGVQIGSNVTIGAGSVVLKDVPTNATVVGNPGRVIKLNIEKLNK